MASSVWNDVSWTSTEPDPNQDFTSEQTLAPLSGNLDSGITYYFSRIGMVIGVFGTVANSMMLFVLSYFKENRKSSTNILILNQTALDFVCCLSLTIAYTLTIGGYYYEDTTTGKVICLLFHTSTFVYIGLIGSIVGLEVIAFERYVKIVHPVTHKKFYRQWMLVVGMILPWFYGTLTSLPFHIATVSVSAGQCLPLSVWYDLKLQLFYGAMTIIGTYLFPIILFVYCYGRIGLVIRGRTRTVAQQSTATDKHAEKQAHKESNVIQTLILVSVMFLILWMPIQVYYIIGNTGFLLDLNGVSWNVCLMIAYVNPMINPLLYAWQYKSVKDSFKKIIKRRTFTDGEHSINQST